MSLASSVGFLRWQGPVIASLASTATRALWARPSGSTPALPTADVVEIVAPRPRALIDAYVRHVGGDPGGWRGRVPPHMSPQWFMPAAALTLRGLPLPLFKVVNGGCRMEVRGEIPDDRPLHVRARLRAAEQDARKTLLVQEIVTGPQEQPDALTIELRAIVPADRDPAPPPPTRPERARVPHDARELRRLKLGPDAGLHFAALTGDINPIHWLEPWARAFGHPSVILHGFSSYARCWEALARVDLAGASSAITMLDVRFRRPLRLPARVSLFRRDAEIFMGTAPGAPAFLTGQFAIRAPTPA